MGVSFNLGLWGWASHYRGGGQWNGVGTSYNVPPPLKIDTRPHMMCTHPSKLSPTPYEVPPPLEIVAHPDKMVLHPSESTATPIRCAPTPYYVPPPL